MTQPADNRALETLVAEVERLESAVAEAQVERVRLVVRDAALAATAERLRCLSGVGPMTSVALVAKVGDFSRFRGGVAKTGSSHLRKLVVEEACACERPRGPWAGLGLRREVRVQTARAPPGPRGADGHTLGRS